MKANRQAATNPGAAGSLWERRASRGLAPPGLTNRSQVNADVTLDPVGKGVFAQNLSRMVRDDRQTIELEMELALAAEAQGFGSIWTAEHHFTGYHMVPGVTKILTYLAARTATVRLGSMVIVLPWQEPTRIAEELAMLDILSGGRLVLGLGRGLGKVEFDGHCRVLSVEPSSR